MTKSELRKLLRSRRGEFVALRGNNEFSSGRILDIISNYLNSNKIIVASYAATHNECRLVFASPLPFQLALPAAYSREEGLVFREYFPDDPLECSPLGFMQPLASASEVRPDVILTPLLGFDLRFNRLGQGAGHYDRAFAAFPDAFRIGIAWSCQEVDEIPCDDWDVPLHAIVTEEQSIVAQKPLGN